MNLSTLKQTKPIIIFALTLALLGGVSYGGYWYWRLRQPTSETQPPAEEPEKVYEIIDNPDGSHTFICYKFNFKFDYPDTWEFSERYSDLRGATGSDKVGAVKIRKKDGKDAIIFTAGVLRDKSRFPTFRDLVVHLSDKSEIPPEPNTTVGGVPAFSYGVLDGGGYRDALEIMFETADSTFLISADWEDRNDPEYRGIIESFEFTN